MDICMYIYSHSCNICMNVAWKGFCLIVAHWTVLSLLSLHFLMRMRWLSSILRAVKEGRERTRKGKKRKRKGLVTYVAFSTIPNKSFVYAYETIFLLSCQATYTTQNHIIFSFWRVDIHIIQQVFQLAFNRHSPFGKRLICVRYWWQNAKALDRICRQ